MKKASDEVKVYDETATDNSDRISNAKPAVAGGAEGILSEKELSKFEYDAQMDLESEIMRDLNQPQMEPDEPEDTDSPTSEDVDTDPFCGL